MLAADISRFSGLPGPWFYFTPQAPVNPVDGLFWLDPTVNTLYYSLAGSWHPFGGQPGGGGATAVTPTMAFRGNQDLTGSPPPGFTPELGDVVRASAAGAAGAAWPGAPAQITRGAMYYFDGTAWQEWPGSEAPVQIVADTAGLNAIANPADGDLVYQTDISKMWLRSGNTWVAEPDMTVVADTAALTALGSLPDGSLAYQVDTGAPLVRQSGSWVPLNPEITFGTAALPGGTAGSPTGIGAAWKGLNPRPTDPIVVATFAGATYLKTGDGGDDADWTAMGGNAATASVSDLPGGTSGSVAGIGAAWAALNPKPADPINLARFADAVYLRTGAGGADGDWSLVVPPVGPGVTVGTAALPGGTAGSPTGIGAAWKGLNPRPTDPIVVATFAGATYIKKGDGGDDADWAALGSGAASISVSPLPGGATGSPAGIGAAWTALAPKPADPINMARFADAVYLRTGAGGADGDWETIVPPPPTVTVGTTALPGGTAGSITGIGAAWKAQPGKPSDPIIIATYAGAAYIKTGTGGDDADWTVLGASATASVSQLPGGDRNDKTDIGKAWTALGTKPSEQINTAVYGGALYLRTGAGGADADWDLMQEAGVVKLYQDSAPAVANLDEYTEWFDTATGQEYVLQGGAWGQKIV